ncbi:hypothetical protein PGTUg99_015095 [Puccinia graminis f. sp. tritici]|uniref:Uncharacterized protein n=1 Tax=Puccinia graminis f. sp. tritici TaxID=56615 RepID=A0A5B0RMC0_PUCGR|nr:hypothetical protein PGTUg99_015095 [Puccinia graminis f. sp. tritici]
MSGSHRAEQAPRAPSQGSAANGVNTVLSRMSPNNRFNPLGSNGRVNLLLSPQETGHSLSSAAINPNMFLQGNATGAGTNTTELARNQHPGLEEDVMDVTEGHEGNGSRGGVATSNLFGQVPEELMRRLSLDDNASSLVRQLSEVRPEDQWIVSIALLVANLSGAHLIQGEPARPREIAGAVEVVPGPFNYVQTIRVSHPFLLFGVVSRPNPTDRTPYRPSCVVGFVIFSQLAISKPIVVLIPRVAFRLLPPPLFYFQ